MSRHIVHAEPAPLRYGGPVQMEPEPEAESPFRILHRHLRGRYLLATLLAVLGGLAGGIAGYESQTPTYRAEGLISLQATLPSPDNPVQETVVPMFEHKMALQTKRLQTSTIADEAMRSDTWKRVEKEFGSETFDEFISRLIVERKRNTPYISISFEDPSPRVAFAGLTSVIGAYLHIAEQRDLTAKNLENVEGKIKELEEGITDRDTAILSVVNEYAVTDAAELKFRSETAMQRYVARDEKLQVVQDQIEGFRGSPESKPPQPMDVEDIKLIDEEMSDRLATLSHLRHEHARLRGLMPPSAQEVVDLATKIRYQEQLVEERKTDFNRKRLADWERATEQGTGTHTTLAQLEDLRGRLQVAVDRANAEAREVTEAYSSVLKLQTDNEKDQRKLDEQYRLRDFYKDQHIRQDTVQVEDPGRMPTQPYRDRRVMYGLLGGATGAGLGVLIVLLLGFRDRRLKGAADIDHPDQSLSRVRLLGLVPSLPSLQDPQGVQIAAHCVHQIRMLLQVGIAREKGTTLCITGPSVGTGKTTVSAALALSFATSGSRTLLIDADLSGRGLTRVVRQMLLGHVRAAALGSGRPTAPPKPGEPGQHLLQPLLSTPEATPRPEAADLMDLLSRSLDRLGADAAKASGVVADVFSLADLISTSEERENLASQLMGVLAKKRGAAIGSATEPIPEQVKELTVEQPQFNGVPVERYLYRTGVEKLRFLPLRGLGQGGYVSGNALGDVLARVSQEDFDVVLVDTGPARGDVETSFVAARADGVVLVVSPEDDRTEAERTVRHLESVGATLAGVVFNRARQKEIIRVSGSASVSRSVPRD